MESKKRNMKHTCNYLLLITFLLTTIKSIAQVGVGTTTFQNGAILQVESDIEGVLITRVNLVAKNNTSPITGTPATGLLVYNKATSGTFPNNVVPGFYYWDGTQWRNVNDTKENRTVKYTNNSTSVNFNSATGVNIDIFNNLSWNEDTSLYQKISNTELRILQTGYYQITCNLALNAADIEQYIELRLRLNTTDVGDKIFGLSPEDSGNGGDFSIHFTQTILVNANDILSLRSYRSHDDKAIYFESLGTSSIVIKKIR